MSSEFSSPEPQKTLQEIEADLLAQLEFARAQYEKLRKEALAGQADACDTIGNADGALALRHANVSLTAMNRGFAQYRAALKAFTDFTLNGTIPESQPLRRTKSEAD